MRSDRNDWVRVRMNTGELFCERCGDSYVMTMPVSVNVAVAISKAYGKDHSSCRPKAVAK